MLDKIAINLANEGVPVAAICRSTQLDRASVLEILNTALARGDVSELPKPDWPPGQSRQARVPTVVDNTPIRAVISSRLGVSGQSAKLLYALLNKPLVTYDQALLAIDSRSDGPTLGRRLINVVVFKLREGLIAAGIGTKKEPPIRTVWGQGIELPADIRAAVLGRLELKGL